VASHIPNKGSQQVWTVQVTPSLEVWTVPPTPTATSWPSAKVTAFREGLESTVVQVWTGSET
jgi:hypothetical protein